MVKNDSDLRILPPVPCSPPPRIDVVSVYWRGTLEMVSSV
jgi:hypothetical protein